MPKLINCLTKSLKLSSVHDGIKLLVRARIAVRLCMRWTGSQLDSGRYADLATLLAAFMTRLPTAIALIGSSILAQRGWSMRSIAFIVVAGLGIPQAALGQQLTTPRIPPWAPFAVNSSTAADSTQSLAPADDRMNAAAAAALSKRTLVGAGVGFVLGAGGTWVVLNTGGSTALCDRDANQDAMSAGECAGITVLGGVAGALVGALIAHLL